MNQTLFSLFQKTIELMNALVYLIIGLALVGFLWGVARFVLSGANEKLKKEGRDFMIYGILILFVMTSLWGLVYLFRNFVLGEPYQGDVNSGLDTIDTPDTDTPFENTDQLFDQPDQVAV